MKIVWQKHTQSYTKVIVLLLVYWIVLHHKISMVTQLYMQQLKAKQQDLQDFLLNF